MKHLLAVFSIAVAVKSFQQVGRQQHDLFSSTFVATPRFRGVQLRKAGYLTPLAANGLVDGSPQDPKRNQKRTKKLAIALPNVVVQPDIAIATAKVGHSTPPASVSKLLQKYALGAVGVVAGLLALLYTTSFFEAVMHSTSGLSESVGNSAMLAATTGVAVGALHTVAGPDHLAGLAPLVVGQRRSPVAAFGLGALWGTGHATGQLLIGIACLAVKLGFLDFAWAGALDQFSGALVGLSLVAIGLLGYHEARHYNDAETHIDCRGSKGGRFGWTTYVTGVLHGLSPDALIFIAPALALPRLAAVCHVVGVGAGTLLSMGGCTALLSALCCRSPRLRMVSSGASYVAMLLGACIFAASLGFSVPLPGL